MPPDRTSTKLLEDVLNAADFIQKLAVNRSQADFLQDKVFRDAVQWNFVVVGEAMSQLHQTSPDTAEQITEWDRIIGFRNQLIHGYGVIRDTITWDIIQKKVPVLIDDVKKLLGR